MAWAVSATTTTPANRASERILRVTARPSSPGSWISIRTMSGSSRVISARHSAPLPALRTEKPFFSRRNWARRKFTGLSSTIKTLPAVTAALDALADPAELVLHRLGGPGLRHVTHHAEFGHQRLVAGHRADQHRDVRRRGPRPEFLQHLPAVLDRQHGFHHDQVGQD